MVRLTDIARECGISVTQVSRALGDFDDVSEKTKLKVKKVADDLGYIPNENARKLVQKINNEIHFVISFSIGDIELKETGETVTSFGINNIIMGINKYCVENSLEQVIHYCDPEKESYLDFCKNRGIRGVILFGAEYENKDFKEITVLSDFPFVSIDNEFDTTIKANKAFISVDNRKYAKIATSKLIESGKKRILMLSGNGESFVEFERLNGYKDALNENSIDIDDELIVNSDFSYSKAFDIVTDYINKGIHFDSIFAVSDMVALAAISALREQNVKVPSEISVCGFDGIDLGEFVLPKLTTVWQNFFEKGYMAAKVLHQILNKDKNYIKNNFVECKLLEKGST